MAIVNEHFDSGYTAGRDGAVYSPPYTYSRAEKHEYYLGFTAGHGDRTAVHPTLRKQHIPMKSFNRATRDRLAGELEGRS